MKYVLFFCGTAQDQREWEALSDEAREKRYAKVGGWFQEHGQLSPTRANCCTPARPPNVT